ncbi:MAG: TPM domain-containing protein [Polyangiaceae bacterium]
MRARVALLLGLLAFFAAPARAYDVPPLHGHVVDGSGQLGAEDIAYLDAQLERARVERGASIVAFVTGPLAGEPIEDVAYRAFNQWGVGDADADDGVLIVIASEDHRVRIETGRGIGDRLTDLEARDIIDRTIAPLIAEGRYRSAIEQGALAIEQATDTGDRQVPVPKPPSAWTYVGLAALLLLVVGLAVVSPFFRGLLFFGFLFGDRGRGRSDPGSGYGGGGGSSGGGGASG